MDKIYSYVNKNNVYIYFLGLLILGLIAQSMIEIYFAIQSSSWSYLEASKPDEALIIEAIKFGHIWQFASGYGPFFWGIGKLVHNIMQEEYIISGLRIFFISLKYLAFMLLIFTLHKNKNRFGAIIFSILCMTVPGFLFFGKVISPEYLLILLTSLTICFLIKDHQKIDKYYYAALIAATLLVLTKINMLPILFGIILYAFILDNNADKLTIRLKNILIIGLIPAVIIFIAVYLCGLDKTIMELKMIIAIVPQFEFSIIYINQFLGLNVVTWDQIIVGGIYSDFLPIYFTFIIIFFLLLYKIFRKKIINNILPIILFFIASLMLVNQIFQGMAYSWYIFVISFMYIASLSILIKDTKIYTNIFLISIFLILFFTHGFSRQMHVIQFNDTKNKQLISNSVAIKNMLNIISDHKCLIVGDVDILVPINLSHNYIPVFRSVIVDDMPYDDHLRQRVTLNTPYIRPARFALNQVTRNLWTLPDYFIVNTALSKSPLLSLIIRDNVKYYNKVKSVESLDLYIIKENSCYKMIKQ